MQIAVILPAAGVGKRFGAAELGRSKIETDLAGRAMLLRAIEPFRSRADVCRTILAVNPATIDEIKFGHADQMGVLGVTLVAGGRAERWETVMLALDAVGPEATHIAVHDAARPLTSRKLVDRVFEAARKLDAVIPGQPVSATLKRTAMADEVDLNADDPAAAILGADHAAPRARRVTQTVDRTDVVEVQTPQVFEVNLLRSAYARLRDGTLSADGITDDAGLIEALGKPVYVVEGEPTNLKITRPEDMPLAEAIVQSATKDDKALLARKRLFGDDDED